MPSFELAERLAGACDISSTPRRSGAGVGSNIQVTGLAPQTVSFVWEVDNMALAHHGCLEEPDLEKRQPEENARNAPRRPRRADRAAWAIAPFVFLVHFWRGWSEKKSV